MHKQSLAMAGLLALSIPVNAALMTKNGTHVSFTYADSSW